MLVSAKQIFPKEYILYEFWELQFEFLLSFKEIINNSRTNVYEKFENIDNRGTSPVMNKSVNLKEYWNEKKYQVTKNFIIRMYKTCNSLNLITNI